MRHRTRAQKGKRPRVKSKKARIGHFGPRDVRATHDTPRDRHLSSNGQVSLSPRSNPTLRLKIQVSAKTHGRRQKYVPPIKRHAAHVVHGPSLTLHHLANGGNIIVHRLDQDLFVFTFSNRTVAFHSTVTPFILALFLPYFTAPRSRQPCAIAKISKITGYRNDWIIPQHLLL